MPTPKLELVNVYLTATEVQKELGLSRFQLDIRIQKGILPPPTFTDNNGVRYFSEGWVTIAKTMLNKRKMVSANNPKERKRKAQST